MAKLRVFDPQDKNVTAKYNHIMHLGSIPIEHQTTMWNELSKLLLKEKYLSAWNVTATGRILFGVTDSLASELAVQLTGWENIVDIVTKRKLQVVDPHTSIDFFNVVFSDDFQRHFSILARYHPKFKERTKGKRT